jgi:1,4-dihydroxy-2-naphthoyl-CoA hydrolase
MLDASAPPEPRPIWHRAVTVDELNAWEVETLGTTLGMRFSAIGPDWIEMTMPVGPRVHQPMGLLHGGASVALAETLGSVGGWLTLDPEQSVCVGLEINANHVRGVREGVVTGRAEPLHLGRTTQLWQIRIRDERDRLVCASRITLAVRPLRP